MRIRRWAGWLGYVAFVAVVSLALCEVALRFLYQEPWYQRLVTEQSEHGEFAYDTNSLGLRDRDYPADKPATVRRVLFLGDSFTFGSGVPDAAAIFPELVEKGLNEGPAVPGVERIEVLNGAIPGSYPAHWHELLRNSLDSFQPDVAVVVFFLRDGTRMSSMNHFFGPIRDKIVERNANSPLYRWSYIHRVLRDRNDRQEVARNYTRDLHRGYFGRGRRAEHWPVQQEHLHAIFEIGRERSISIGFVVFPVLAQLSAEPYPFQRICNMLVRFARRSGVPVLNLLEAFRGHEGPELWVSSYDQHPNPMAHGIAAEALLPFVERLLRRAEVGALPSPPHEKTPGETR